MKKQPKNKTSTDLKIVNHQFRDEEFYSPGWKIKYLFLGTFNPEGGEEVKYYYGRPRNRMWELVSDIFNKSFDIKDGNFMSLIMQNGIACLDMIDTLKVPSDKIDDVLGKGYRDDAIINNSVIRTYNTTKINTTIKNNPGVKVYSTWGKGRSLIDWTSEISKISKIPGIIPLVSPSMVAKVPEGTEKFEYMLKNWREKVKVTRI